MKFTIPKLTEILEPIASQIDTQPVSWLRCDGEYWHANFCPICARGIEMALHLVDFDPDWDYGEHVPTDWFGRPGVESVVCQNPQVTDMAIVCMACGKFLDVRLTSLGARHEIAYFEETRLDKAMPTVEQWYALHLALSSLRYASADPEKVVFKDDDNDLATRITELVGGLVQAHLPTTVFQKLILRIVERSPNIPARGIGEILWPNAMGWRRHYSAGPYGSTTGSGMWKAAGSQMGKLMRQKGWFRYDLENVSTIRGNQNYISNGYVLTGAGKVALKAVPESLDDLLAAHLERSSYEKEEES